MASTSATDLSNTFLDSNEKSPKAAERKSIPPKNRFQQSRFSDRDSLVESPSSSLNGVTEFSGKGQQRVKRKAGRPWYHRRRAQGLLGFTGFICLLFLVNSSMLSRLPDGDGGSKSQLSEDSSWKLVKVSVPVCEYMYL